jgi:hypothetical protein
VGRRRVKPWELDSTLVTGSRRRLVLSNPELPAGVADHGAYGFCVLEQLHRGLRRREIYALGADRWGDPRARRLDGNACDIARPRILDALALPAEPDGGLARIRAGLNAKPRILGWQRGSTTIERSMLYPKQKTGARGDQVFFACGYGGRPDRHRGVELARSAMDPGV